MKKFTKIIMVIILITLVAVTTLAKEVSLKSNTKTVKKVNKELKESDIKDNSILRPSFETVDGTLNAGTAFTVKIDSYKNPLVLTAIHIFGPSGGLGEDIPSDKLPDYVKKVKLNDVFNQSYIGECNKVLLIPLAKPVPKINKDVAAFIASEGIKLSTLELSNQKLAFGDKVWLVASLVGTEDSNKKLHRATVIESDNKVLAFEYENPNIDLTATSGAPILNNEGKVVGINISMYEADKKLIGIANPSISINKLLKKSAKSN